MSRFLTPAKIGLLALIELYVEGAVPNEGIIPVINFLASNLTDCDLSPTAGNNFNPTTDRWKKAESAIRLVVSIKDFEALLSPLSAADKLPGRRLWDRFLEKLWGIDSLHGLHEFFAVMPGLLRKTREEMRRLGLDEEEEQGKGVRLGRNSPFGAFVRRAHVEFVRMKFEGVTELWKMFVRYRQPTAGYWTRRHPQYGGRLSFDAVLMEGEEEWGGRETDELAVMAYGRMLLPVVGGDRETLPVSTDDVEGLLEFQIEQIQKYGIRIPPQIRDRFKTFLKGSHVVPSLSHYLSFSDSWRSGDFPTSFDYLHRYFDYTMLNRDRLFYQYALMNLAIVQSDFGCHKEAVATMLEAVSTARENRDMTCLNFALNWFFHFGRAHPHLVRELENSSMLDNGKETLAFLRVKAKETGMWILWGSALLSEAKLGMANGESVSVAFEHMVRSSQLIVERNMKTMMGAQLSMNITMWDRLGLSPMSSMACQVFLSCHARSSVFDDELKITYRLAGLLAGKGKYEEAFSLLESLDSNSLRSAKPNQYWHLYRGLLKLRRDLHRNNLPAADTLLSQLLQTGPEDLDQDMVFIIDTLHIESLIRHKDFESAFTKVDSMITSLRENNRDIALRIRLLLAKAHLFDSINRPEKGFSIAMRAASMAWRALLIPLLWQAIGAVANILNSLSEFSAAAQLLLSILPRVLETDVLFTAGTLYNLLADARMGQAGQFFYMAGSESSTEQEKQRGRRKQRELAMRAHAALESAYKYFERVEDVEKQGEVLAKMATVMRVLGDEGVSEGYAARYLSLKRESERVNG
ncbi:anaphase-promoting complex subunit 5-domain-containing protein [Apiosordaria backusii]|uniref:Anaphase-promoting complex subunit 5 n=1 Tax=Apiosordaria backusii TaxID=314023 RepID=A0AA40AXC5_9PEZI|nr:anaphase-promoting complex subunit 5-domain-containing protein [Apiosordaria backusii]